MVKSKRKQTILDKLIKKLTKGYDMQKKSHPNALDVSNYLVYILNGACSDLTNFKINKLLYYIQGHYLKQFGRPLFSDPIEAWGKGPVVSSVYLNYKKYQSSPITEWTPSRLDNISKEDKLFIFDVARVYCLYNSTQLYDMTHQESGPWDKAFKEDESHVEIPINDIKEYFIQNEQPLPEYVTSFPTEPVTEKRDQSGILVLPKDFQD